MQFVFNRATKTTAVVSDQGQKQAGPECKSEAGLTFWEVIFAFAMVAVMFVVIIQGYTVTARRAAWTGFSLAAQQFGVQTVEQLRAAVWRPATGMAEITNINLMDRNITYSNGMWSTITGYTTNLLDLPWKGTNYYMATNWVTVRQIPLQFNNAMAVQMVRVDTVWPFNGWDNFHVRYYTNTISTYFAPN